MPVQLGIGIAFLNGGRAQYLGLATDPPLVDPRSEQQGVMTP